MQALRGNGSITPITASLKTAIHNFFKTKTPSIVSINTSGHHRAQITQVREFTAKSQKIDANYQDIHQAPTTFAPFLQTFLTPSATPFTPCAALRIERVGAPA